MICANNYVFDLLNGSFVTVVGVSPKVETVQVWGVDLHFQNVDVEDKNPDGAVRVQTVKLLLNALDDAKHADIGDDVRNALFEFYRQRYVKLSAGAKANAIRLREDLYFNALRAKYGYAITCHKAQGGEWKEAAIAFDSAGRNDVGSEEMRNWTYTALTRAKEKVYLEDAPEVHPLTRIQMAVPFGGLAVLADRLRARIVDKYGAGTQIEFLSTILTTILAPLDCGIVEIEQMKDCYRITFEQSGIRTCIDFYLRGKVGKQAVFGKVYAPHLAGMNPSLATDIQTNLALALLPP